MCYRADQDQKKVQLNLFSLFFIALQHPAQSRNPSSNRASQYPGIASPPARQYKDCAKRDHSFVMNELPPFELGKSSVFGEDCTVLSRIYLIIHDKKTLILINEMFPIDDRWSL